MGAFLTIWLALLGAALAAGSQSARNEAPEQATTTADIKTLEELSIGWVVSPTNARQAWVEVSGLPPEALAKLANIRWGIPQWQRLFSVHASQGDVLEEVGMPAMAGRYRVEGSVLRFEPLFPLEPEVNYRAVFRPEALPSDTPLQHEAIAAAFQLEPPRREATTRVLAVYPSAPVLPENLLKFYIHFSAPMTKGRAYQHIHLRDQLNREVAIPFLEIDEELWDPSMTRLTLFMDPGRVKNGLKPRKEVGSVLQAGLRYRLVIDNGWSDDTGSPLKESFEHEFEVGPPDNTSPDLERWGINAPRAGSQKALVVEFGEPLDHALALRLIRVLAADGKEVEGDAELKHHQQQWHFTPRSPWSPGSYELAVRTTIEDLAGNNIGKPFEVHLDARERRKFINKVVRRGFIIDE